MSTEMIKKNHTFVICAYGDSEFLEECILSLKEQTVQTSIILYTSTPSDYIERVCGKYKIPIHVATGGSIGKDWNNALSFVTTDYATIAHQDDVYLPTYAEELLTLFAANEEGLIAYTNYREWKDGAVIPLNINLKIKNIMLKTMSLFNKSIFWRKRVMAFGNPICCPAVTYNLKKLGNFKFNEDMRVSLDWLAWHDIGSLKGQFLFSNQELMWHRIHGESETSNTISDNTRTNEDIYMFNKFWPEPITRLIMKFYIKSQDSNA